jgi:hypothetical protein
LLSRLYDPRSADYRHFLSVDQFTEQFGPTAEDYQAVVDFAQANGFTVTGTPANRMLVPISGTIAQIERAFHVSMKVYQDPTEKRTFYSGSRALARSHSAGGAHRRPKQLLQAAPNGDKASYGADSQRRRGGLGSGRLLPCE